MSDVAQLPYGTVIKDELLAQGQRLGPYVVQERLGVHLYGALYRVHKDQYGKLLIHVLPRALSSDPAFHKAYLGRCAKLATTKHAGLLEIKDGNRYEECLVVEYSDVPEIQTLSSYFYARNPDPGLPMEEARGILQGVSEALKVARQKMMGHFMLTPEMVLVTPDGKTLIYGCGLFESLDRRRFEVFLSSAIIPLLGETERVHLTAMDVMAPEVRNDEDYDQRADIFSLGIITYFLLTGRKPTREWTLPSQVRSDLTEGWDLFASRCLEPEPTNRFNTLQTFLDDLQRAEKLHHVAKSQERSGGAAREGNPRVLRSLEAIPLPAGLSKRYSRNTLNYIRLGLLLSTGAVLVGGAAVGLNQWTNSQVRPTGAAAAATVAKVDAASLQTGLLLRTNVPRATVKVAGEERQFILTGGSLALAMPAGTYALSIAAPNYRPAQIKVEVPSGKTPAQASATLQPDFGDLEVSSLAGADLELVSPTGDFLLLAEIPPSGVLRLSDRLMAGEHHLRVIEEGYRPHDFRVTLPAGSQQPVEVAPTLTALPGTLKIVTQPPGQAVALDGVSRGVTPLVIEELPIGQPLAVSLVDPRFTANAREIVLRPGETRLVDFGTLIERRGELALRVTLNGQAPTAEDLAALTIELPGEDSPRTASASQQLELPAGPTRLRVAHPDYLPREETVDIADNAKQDLTIDLKPQPARLVVQVPAEMPSALYLGNERLTPGPNGIYAVPALQPISLRLLVRNYQPIERELNLPPNRDFAWKPELASLPGPQTGEAWTIPYLNATFAWVPAGRDEIGSPVNEPHRRPADGPITPVTITQGYWMGTHEVSQALYRVVMKASPSQNRGDSLPVDSVTWREAMEFCWRLTEQERAYGRLPAGHEYRLPTEVEWEYAARAGSDAPFAFGAEAIGGEQGNFRGNYPRDFRANLGATGNTVDATYAPRPIGSYVPNAWGLYDMHGNVAEWTLDGYLDRLPGVAVGNYTRALTTMGRAVRGGSWQQAAEFARSAARDRAGETTSRTSLGFRIVLAPAQNTLTVREPER